MTEKAGNSDGLTLRLISARKRLGLTQDKMAERLGVSTKTIQNRERGRRQATAAELAELVDMGISSLWLLTGKGDPSREQIDGATGTKVPYQQIEDYVLLPRYDVHAAAGVSSVVHSEQIVDFLAFRLDWVRRVLSVPPEDLALISAVGDSMNPTIKNGDLLLLNKSIQRVQDNAIYVLQANGELLVKRLQMLTRGGVRIISDNIAYPPEEVHPRDVVDLNVVGRVVWHGGMI